MSKKLFSQTLGDWLKSPDPKTFGDLENIFKEKSFAVAFLILMVPAALPLPTGGITHVFEIITLLLAIEMILGRSKIWSPKFWKRRNLGKGLEKKGLPKLVKFIEWFEKRSQKRLTGLINDRQFLRLIGVLIFALTLAALLAIPFSGLDTLPALGVVVISLALILEDALMLLYAIGIGLAGVILEIGFSSLALKILHR